MNYEQFLLTQLLIQNIKEFDEMAYDTLWDLSFDLIKEAEEVEPNEYGDYLNKYINDNKEKLINLATKHNN